MSTITGTGTLGCTSFPQHVVESGLYPLSHSLLLFPPLFLFSPHHSLLNYICKPIKQKCQNSVCKGRGLNSVTHTHTHKQQARSLLDHLHSNKVNLKEMFFWKFMRNYLLSDYSQCSPSDLVWVLPLRASVTHSVHYLSVRVALCGSLLMMRLGLVEAYHSWLLVYDLRQGKQTLSPLYGLACVCGCARGMEVFHCPPFLRLFILPLFSVPFTFSICLFLFLSLLAKQ